MNSRHLIDAVGLWAEVRVARPVEPGPVLLLDRDGVLIEDTGYVSNVAQVRVYPGVPAAIARARTGGFRIGLVTNQSGIGRGLYDWDTFAAVQEKIDAALLSTHASIDAVFACAYHKDAHAPYDISDHAWRKPKPGMIFEALKCLNGDAAISALVGDRESDIAAARAAGLGRAILLNQRGGTPAIGLADAVVASLDDAVSLLLAWPHRPLPA